MEKQTMEKNSSRPISGNRSKQKSSLDMYLKEINRVPLMSAEEEREVALRAKNGDQQAIDHLVQANLRFVVSVAKKYMNQGLPLEDLINDGNVGLITAAHRFDVERGYKFISYAVWWIRQAMLQSLSHHSRIVRVPLNRANVIYKIGKAKRELEQRFGREPSPEEIAEYMDLPLKEVREAGSIANVHMSLDSPVLEEGDDNTMGSKLEDETAVTPEYLTFEGTLSEDLEKVLATLPEREREIIVMYYGLNGEEPITLEEIGQRIGLTRERIRQIKEKAIQRLKHKSRADFLEGYR
jgi:RNA polymerase primary sigma factor